MTTPLRTLMAALALALAASVSTLAAVSPAAAYPEDSCSVTLSSQTVLSGETLTVYGSASGARTWTVEWNGTTQVRSGSSFSVSFTAPTVAKATTIPVHVDSTPAGARAITMAGCSLTYAVTVSANSVTAAPGDTGDRGLLADTGGPRLVLLLVALALMLAGALSIRAARRGRLDACESSARRS